MQKKNSKQSNLKYDGNDDKKNINREYHYIANDDRIFTSEYLL